MNDESLIPKTTIASLFYVMGFLALSVLGLVYFDEILKPFIIAFFIWFIINQLKLVLDRISLKGKRLPSSVSSALALILVMLVIYFVTEILVKNLENIGKQMPDYLGKLNFSYNGVESYFGNPEVLEYLQMHINEFDVSGIIEALISSLSGLISALAVVVVYVIFFLMERATYVVKIEKLFPVKGKAYEKFNTTLNNIFDSIRFYIWSKTLISLVTGAVSFFILLGMQVEYAFLWSFLIFILNFIPYIGPFISSLLPAVFAGLVTGDYLKMIYVFAAMEGVQIILGNFVEPKVMGQGSNLSPVTVLLSLAFWGMIWGIPGMILAVPVTSLIVIVCSQIPSARFIAILLSEKGEIDTID